MPCLGIPGATEQNFTLRLQSNHIKIAAKIASAKETQAEVADCTVSVGGAARVSLVGRPTSRQHKTTTIRTLTEATAPALSNTLCR